MTSPAMTDWVEHTGGECPVAPETMVDVRYRLDGRSLKGDRIKAHYLRWRHNKSETRSGGGDIIAYRIISPAASPAMTDWIPSAADLHAEGYAPGGYSFKCIHCEEIAIGDKRAIHCLKCATEIAKAKAKHAVLASAPSPQTQDVGELVEDLLSIDFTEAAAALQAASATVATLTAELDDYKLSAILASDPREAFRHDLADLRATVAAQGEEIEQYIALNDGLSPTEMNASFTRTRLRAEAAEAAITSLRAELAGVFERCAKVADAAQDRDLGKSSADYGAGHFVACGRIAAAIRALSQEAGE